MKGFHKILKLKIWNTYGNARAIADDIITSLMANHDCNPLLTTYASTIRQSLLSTIADIFSTDVVSSSDDETNGCDYIDESNDDVATWVIRIYSCDGNRGSKLSISQNQELFSRLIEKVDSTDSPPTFTDTLMALYRMHSSLRFAADKYRMSKMSSDDELARQRLDIKSKADGIICHVENMYAIYPNLVNARETDFNEILRNTIGILNKIERDESGLRHINS